MSIYIFDDEDLKKIEAAQYRLNINLFNGLLTKLGHLTYFERKLDIKFKDKETPLSMDEYGSIAKNLSEYNMEITSVIEKLQKLENQIDEYNKN